MYFCLVVLPLFDQFNFNPMIVSWWRQQGARRYDTMECLEMTVATGASFTITNHGPLNHCFDCQFIWCACWPCYCLSAVPYKIWRNFIQGVHDVEVEIHGHVTTAFPSSSGYDLFELHLGSSLHAGTEELMPSAPPLPHGIFDQPFHQGNVGGVFMWEGGDHVDLALFETFSDRRPVQNASKSNSSVSEWTCVLE